MQWVSYDHPIPPVRRYSLYDRVYLHRDHHVWGFGRWLFGGNLGLARMCGCRGGGGGLCRVCWMVWVEDG